MISYDLFTGFIIIAILMPLASVIILLLMLSFEQEISLLKNENTKVTLEKELQHSEYMQLNQQIQPHFLFNTVNLLLSLARLKKTEQLIEVLEQLSLFLRFRYQIKDQLIPFEKELSHAKNYLFIQKIRFGQRLKVDFHIEQELNQVLVPPYLLQTLIENAFKHGIEKKIGQVSLSISFMKEEHYAVLEVSKNGVGVNRIISFPNEVFKGHGLYNIYRRLELLFGEDISLALKPKDGGGTEVIVRWPYIIEKEEVNQ